MALFACSEAGSRSSAAGPVEVNAAWRALGAEHGQTAALGGALPRLGPHEEPEVDLAGELLVEVTRDQSMITERELRAKACELRAGVCRPAQTTSSTTLRVPVSCWRSRAACGRPAACARSSNGRSRNAAVVSELSLQPARREVGKEIRGLLTAEQREALEMITGPGGVAVLKLTANKAK
jgi:hypothetical protein